MADLKAGIPPVEFRELDLRSGVPRPRPVDIMLVDLRPRPYPEEAAARAARADAPAPPPAATPFAGQGRTLADDAAPAANAAAASAAASGTEWPLAGQTQPEVDTSLPTTEVQLRLAGGGTRRFRLNLTNSILDLRGVFVAPTWFTFPGHCYAAEPCRAMARRFSLRRSSWRRAPPSVRTSCSLASRRGRCRPTTPRSSRPTSQTPPSRSAGSDAR
uniref:Uncharacterized protein n=1 Tax=Chrysotila carterae TaxID=13221 RepID=A0A7S4EUA6_CHRCT